MIPHHPLGTFTLPILTPSKLLSFPTLYKPSKLQPKLSTNYKHFYISIPQFSLISSFTEIQPRKKKKKNTNMTRIRSMIRFRRCIVKLKSCMKFMQPVRPIASDDEQETVGLTETAVVPKGHFTVLAGNGEKDMTRFVVELRLLRNPALLQLLKEAEEMYGFQQEGALVVPCRPAELQKILADDMYDNK